MATLRGLTLEIDGNTSKLDIALKGVNSNTRDLQNELKTVDRLLKLDPKNTELLAQKQNILNSSIKVTTEKLNTLKEAQKQAQEQFNKGEITEAQFRKLKGEIIETELKLKSLNNEINKGKGLENLKNGFKNVGEGATNLGKKLTPLSLVAGGVFTGIVAMTTKAGAMADDLNTLSAQTGISTDNLQKFQYASELIDVSMDALTGGLVKLTKNMSSATDESKGMGLNFTKLGVSIRDDLTGELRNNQDVFYETIDALAQIENETERDAIAMKIFGKSAQELNPLIKGGADDLKKFGNEAQRAGLILSKETLEAANQFKDKLDELKGAGKGMFFKLGAEISIKLLPFVESLAEKINKLIILVSNLDPKFIMIIGTISLVVAGLAPLLFMLGTLATGISSLIGFIPILGTAFAFLISPIGLVVVAVTGLIAIFVALYKNNEEFRENINIIWESIKKIFTKVLGIIINIVKGFIDQFKLFWGDYGKDIKNIFSVLWESIQKIFIEVTKIIMGILNIFIGLFTGDWEKFKNGIVKIFSGMWELIKNIVGTAWQLLEIVFKNLKEDILKWFGDLVDSARDWGANLIDGFIDGIKNTFHKLKATLSGIKEMVGSLWMGGNGKTYYLDDVQSKSLATKSIGRNFEETKQEFDYDFNKNQQPIYLTQNIYTGTLDPITLEKEAFRQFKKFNEGY